MGNTITSLNTNQTADETQLTNNTAAISTLNTQIANLLTRDYTTIKYNSDIAVFNFDNSADQNDNEIDLNFKHTNIINCIQ